MRLLVRASRPGAAVAVTVDDEETVAAECSDELDVGTGMSSLSWLLLTPGSETNGTLAAEPDNVVVVVVVVCAAV